MVLLNSDLKSEMINRIKSGNSINEISRSLGLGKSTIYYYYKKIKGKKFVEPKFKLSNSRLEGEINGIFAGDGSQYYDKKRGHYEVNVHFGAKNYWYAEYVKKLFDDFFHKKFRLNWDSETQIRIRTQSRKIFEYFQNYMSYDPHIKHCTVKLQSHCSPAFKIGFLRGLFDTDGCISYGKYQARIFYTTTSKVMAHQVSSILISLGIVNSIYVRHPKNEKIVYIVNILAKGKNRFIKTVKPMKALRAGNSVR